ncbi:MAG: aminotransferase class V-fold PLP-dependent enzyme [Chitinophagaceae bacterium]|nr:aminotransferase class V-fold PLP-dependent enzyme [Chitinophagaceae bacterium]
MKRREVIKNIGLLSVSGGVAGTLVPAASFAGTRPSHRDLFKELGVTPVINASVTMTFLSGSLMLPEVMEAINSTAHDFANMYELQDKVGAKIAEMLHCEAAMVTSGAACAMVLGTAAAITGKDPEKIKLIPNLPGARPEVIMQKTHRYLFDQAITTTGARIIEVEGPEEMDKAFNSNTVMTLYFNAAQQSSVTREAFVALSKKHNVPSFMDAAADVPPVENLFKYQKMGFDLVTFSGGKMIRGPQSAGLLFGRKDLIEAAKLNHSPHEAPIGRPMKVNKEEMFGMYAALKAYLERDHEKEWQDWLTRIQKIKKIVESVPGVTGQTHIEPGPANAFPSLDLTWDEQQVKISPRDVQTSLRNGTPSIVANAGKGPDGKPRLRVGVVLLKPEQVSIVAQRVREILKNALS